MKIHIHQSSVFLMVDVTILETKRADNPQLNGGLSALRLKRLALNNSYLLVLDMNKCFLLTFGAKQGKIC